MSDVDELIAGQLGSGAPAGGPVADAPAEMADAPSDPVHDAAADLMTAVTAGDPAGVATALRMAFKALELEPHMEGDEAPAPDAG